MTMTEHYPEIAKDVSALEVKPHLDDWAKLRQSWRWDDVVAELDLPGGMYNLAHECIDRHAQSARADKTAMIWESASGEIERYSFSDMQRESNKVANALRALGVKKTDRVFFLAPRIPELYFAVFGALKCGAIVAPLFSAFGPEPIKDRIQRAEGSVIVTTPTLLPKINDIRGELPTLDHVIVIAQREGAEVADGDVDYSALVGDASEQFEIERTGADDWSVMHFTSGTTGLPKGAAHVHNAVIGHYATGKHVLDLHEDDVYWCTADPGWVTGTSYGMFAPWSNGATSVIYEGGFNATRSYEVIVRHKVTVWYTAPTFIRLLMKAGTDLATSHDLSSLRYVMSVGEPLNPEGVVWGEEAFGLPIHDNWWQTETGAIMIANYPSMPIRPGSMGRPFPGIEAAIADDEGNEITEPDREGALVLRPGWPSMMRTYWNDEERYNSRFQHGWYITGDRARQDADGYFWFLGRDDDIINTAGHLVSPFEVESALIEHDAVAEAGVIGKPDALAMEVVKAFVTLHEGFEPTNELRRNILGHMRRRLGPGVAPARDRLHRGAAEDPLGQDHAPAAESPRARPAGRRHLGTRGTTSAPHPHPLPEGGGEGEGRETMATEQTDEAQIHRGLTGVYLDRTHTTFIDGRAGELRYRGYSIHDLAEHSTFEETSYLLLHGELPSRAQLDAFDAELKAARPLPQPVLDVIAGVQDAHPMDVLRTAVSALAAFDDEVADNSAEATLRKGVRLTAQVATAVTAHHHLRHGRDPVAPSDALDHAANFLFMLSGEEPSADAAALMDTDMVLHADHGSNASAFTARVVAGTQANLHAAVVAGIAALSGPAHGGAAENVMRMAQEIGEPERAAEYVQAKRAAREPVMGFGHRVYRAEDPRARHMREGVRRLSQEMGQPQWYLILEAVVEAMQPYARRGVNVNVDFYAGVVYYLHGIPEDLFVPIFAIGRVPGWTVQVLEQFAHNILIRPLLRYEGPEERAYVPIGERK